MISGDLGHDCDFTFGVAGQSVAVSNDVFAVLVMCSV